MDFDRKQRLQRIRNKAFHVTAAHGEENDDDDDDDAIIVYKESAALSSWLQSQKTLQEGEEEEEVEEDRQGKENEHVFQKSIHRRSRRNRCRQLLQLQEHKFLHPDSEQQQFDDLAVSDSRNNSEDDEDVFASLRPVMVQMSQEQKMKLNRQKILQSKSDLNNEGKAAGVINRQSNRGDIPPCIGVRSHYGKNKLDNRVNLDDEDDDKSDVSMKISHSSFETDNKKFNEASIAAADNQQNSSPEGFKKVASTVNSKTNKYEDTMSYSPVKNNDYNKSMKYSQIRSVEVNDEECTTAPKFNMCFSNNNTNGEENNTESIHHDCFRGRDKSAVFNERLNRNGSSVVNINAKKKRKHNSFDRTNNNKAKERKYQRKQMLHKNRSNRTTQEDLFEPRKCDQMDSKLAVSKRRRLHHKTTTSSSFIAVIDKTNDDQCCFSSFTSDQNSKRNKPKTSTNVENAKESIVGLRPTHWSRNSREQRETKMLLKGRQNLHQLAKPSALAAATRSPFMITKTCDKKNNKEETCYGKKEKSANITTVATNKEKERSTSTEPSPKTEIDVKDETTKSFSFAPSFVPIKSIASIVDSFNEDAVGDDSGDDCRVVISRRISHDTIKNNKFALSPSYTKRKRGKVITGEWGRKLIALRNSRSNDSIRLQNQAFARRKVYDMNDPRKRAKTLTDVTILSSYKGPFINVPEEMKITVLGYIHRHIHTRNKNATTKDLQGCLAWFTFTLSTARSINLELACKLRIYNSVILPCSMPITLDLPQNCFLGVRETDNVRCDKIVVCTQLCERNN